MPRGKTPDGFSYPCRSIQNTLTDLVIMYRQMVATKISTGAGGAVSTATQTSHEHYNAILLWLTFLVFL